MKQVNSSEMACRVMGFKPAGKPLESSATCCMCGKALAFGDLAVKRPFKGNTTFMDDASLWGNRDNACGWCASLLSDSALRTFTACLITSEKAWSLSDWGSRAWYFLNPPNEPHLTVFATKQKHHLVWRTPVNLSNKLLTIRYGDFLMHIRHAQMLKAVYAAQALIELTNSTNESKKKVKSFLIGSDPSKVNFGKINPLITKVCAGTPEMSTVLSCSVGELWAIGVIISAADRAEEPPPLEIVTLAILSQRKKERIAAALAAN
jgi:CRISPR type IV-associated protein Csf1